MKKEIYQSCEYSSSLNRHTVDLKVFTDWGHTYGAVDFEKLYEIVEPLYSEDEGRGASIL